MNESLLRRIKKRLNAKFYVMNDSWLRDCIEFFIGDKAPHEITDKHISDFVEGQWQLSDLQEISNENGCLPKNLIQKVHTVLNGTYILQVNKMYDIAKSKYKQLCEIRKKNTDNLEVVEKDKSVEWEPKARRMIQLCLTDGVQHVTAIEYAPLPQMTSTLLPGYKVMIIGPVNCRRGIILLEHGKYKEIGGEVESLLKPNVLENVLARALDEPENLDPYHDNGSPRNRNDQMNTSLNPASENSLFDDDFEEAIDLEAVTAIEQSQKMIKTTHSTSTRKKQDTQTVNNGAEEEYLNIDFEPLEYSDSSMRPLRALPTSRMETEEFEEEDDVMIVEEIPASVHDSRDKLPVPTSSYENENIEFPDDDFDFNDCEIIETKRLPSQQHKYSFKSSIMNKSEKNFLPQVSKSKLANNVPMQTDKYTSREISVMQNKISTASTSKITQQIPKVKEQNLDVKVTSNSHVPLPLPKICDVLSDVLRETVKGTIYRTVRGQVTKHSALTKQGKCWAVTAQIADHTSSIEVCFDSEVLEKFLGFTVQEFSQKKKLAKSDPQINNELRLSLRKAQYQIENLDALLKLELTEDQKPKIIGITELTPQQKEELAKRST